MFGTTPVIPDAPTPASTAPFGAIYAGPEDPENHIGFIRANHDGRFEAFDTDKVLLGLFETFPSACDAIWTDCLGVKSRSNGGRPHARTSEEPDLQLKLAQSQSIAVTFLEKLRPGGPWVLTAIVPDGAITTITAFTADQVEAFVRQARRQAQSLLQRQSNTHGAQQEGEEDRHRRHRVRAGRS